MTESPQQQPTIEQIAAFLEAYGWNYRETAAGEDGQKRVLITNYRLDNGQGLLISLRPEGEFVLVSTVNLLRQVPKDSTPLPKGFYRAGASNL